MTSTHEKAMPQSTDAQSPNRYQQKQKDAARALGQMMSPVKGRIMLARILAVISSAMAVIPYIALTRIGALLLADGSTDRHAVYSMVWLLIYGFLTQAFLYLVALLITHFADLRLRNHIQTTVIDTLAGAPLAWFSDSATGRVRKAIQEDTAKVHTLVAHAPVEQAAAVTTPVVLLIYVFILDWRLGLLSVATFPLYLAAQAFMMRDMGEKTAQMDDKLSDVSAASVELIEGITVVKNFGHTGRAHQRFIDACTSFITFYWDWCGPLMRLSSASIALISPATMTAITLGGGLAMVHAGWVSVPQVLVCTLVGLIVPRSIDVIGMTAWSYQQAGAAALRVEAILNTAQVSYPNSDTTPQSREIDFEDVSYSYTTAAGKVKALDHVSLRLKPGKVTALIGPSGSGKSTLATMLARFRDPDEGRITIGGTDIRELSEKTLYHEVSFVLQNPYLQRLSLREAIRLGRPDATDAQIIHAAQQAQIWDDIAALPNGLDTVIGADTDFSGGQKQRLAIARALVNDAPIVVLDEATASTDPDCAADIQTALAALVEGRTVLVIGHHAEAVKGADQIVVLDNGAIQAQGTAEDLRNNSYWQTLNQGVRHD